MILKIVKTKMIQMMIVLYLNQVKRIRRDQRVMASGRRKEERKGKVLKMIDAV